MAFANAASRACILITMVDYRTNYAKDITTMLNESQPGKKPSSKLTFTEKKLREFFPADYSPAQMRNVIEELLAEWKRNQEEQEET